MIGTAQLYDTFSILLKYPNAGYLQTVAECRLALGEVNGEAAESLGEFTNQMRSRDAAQIEELFVQTFDLNPACVLEVGWHLFGDTYERGAFLVKVREALGSHGVPESTEVPDHLTHLLALLGRMQREEADLLATTAVLPALKKMLAGLEGKGSPFENVLKAIACVLDGQHAGVVVGVKHE